MLTPQSGSRPACIAAALGLALALASSAHAQDSAQTTDTPPQPATADPGASAPGEQPPTSAEPAQAAPAEPAQAATEPAQVATEPAQAASTLPPPAPIMVVVIPTGNVPEALVAAAQAALVDQVAAMVGRRPVHALGAPAIRDAIAACADDACIGAQLAQAGAQAGVVLRLRARGRRAPTFTLELRDPVSGAPRLAPIEGELPLDPAQIPATLAEPLRAAMPPPPGTLLVTVNVDGARVQVDGHDIGISPVAPVEVGEGPHEIIVSARDHLTLRRQARVQAGQHARVDATLQSMTVGDPGEEGAEPVGIGGGAPSGGGDVTGEWWFWAAIGGGGALVLGIVIGVAAAAASGGGPVQQDPIGIPLPPIVGGI